MTLNNIQRYLREKKQEILEVILVSRYQNILNKMQVVLSKRVIDVCKMS
jgi:hypothetical protein